MDKQDFKVGIVGAGWIAAKAAETLNGLDGFRAGEGAGFCRPMGHRTRLWVVHGSD